MKRKLIFTAISLFITSACFAQVYNSREEAMKAARENCAETGETMKSGTGSNHTGEVWWNNGQKSSTQNNGPQNTYSVSGSLSVPISPVKVSGSGSYERKGSQTNTSSESKGESGGNYYYRCE